MDDEAGPLPSSRLLDLTAQIVAAHVAGNRVDAQALPTLIQAVHRALAEAVPALAASSQEPAVPVQRSVFRDYLVCLEDGAKMKMLRRYIARRFALTPEQYRAKWGLPSSYPMTAPAYSERRSELAKEIGFGRKKTPEASKPKAKKVGGRPRRAAAVK